MWMTTLSCVSTEFGGFLKDSLIVFQTAPECSTDLDGKFRTNVSDNEDVGEIKPSIYAGLRAFQRPQVHHLVHHFRKLI